MTLTTFRPFTVEDYHKMAEAGVFAPNERVELLGGLIRPMSPIGAKHVEIVRNLTITFAKLFGDDYAIDIQNPVVLSDESEPEPDAMVVRRNQPRGIPEKAVAANVLLLVEVSDTTLIYDRDEKLPFYAAANIPEVWLINANRNTITQYHSPLEDSYTYRKVFNPSDTIMTTLGVEIQAGDILLL